MLVFYTGFTTQPRWAGLARILTEIIRRTKPEAFGKRRATKAIRKSDPKWMERDSND